MAESANFWLGRIAQYESEFKKWEGRVQKILKRYRDDYRDGRRGYAEARFNILWSNVQVLKEATYNRKPKADVSRRFRDQDPVGRVAALLLERALEFEIDHYPDYDATITGCVLDRFLGGRGTAWVRYEPHFRAAETGGDDDGVQVTEDTDEPDEQLDYECAPTDYVHWRDFGHTTARTWEEVTAVWRRVYMSRAQCVKRFGEEMGRKIPLDSTPQDENGRKNADAAETSKACIYEIWDNETQSAIWVSKSLNEILDERPDPLGLEGFFPCPKPMYATTTSDSLVPIPDFTLYQDQANELDILADRIDGLVKALQVKGVYDAAIPELRRIFSEGGNNDLLPVNNWMAFAEKNGLKGAIDIVDIAPIAKTLVDAYGAMEQVKNQVFEIMGLADIMRGSSDPGETLGAQQIKAQYGGLRLRGYQKQVAQFATSLLQMKAHIICTKFAPQTILLMGGARELAQQDQQYIEPALQLLMGDRLMDPNADTENPLRSFRIEVAADSLIQIDENADKQSRMEFLTATGAFMEKAVQIGSVAPEMMPLMLEMLKFGVTGFKVGKTIEGAFDDTAQKITQMLQMKAQQPPQPDPKMQVEQMKLAGMQQKMQSEARKSQADERIAMIENEGRMIDAQASKMKAEAQLQQTVLGALLPDEQSSTLQ